jgi:hypothetical protein
MRLLKIVRLVAFLFLSRKFRTSIRMLVDKCLKLLNITPDFKAKQNAHSMCAQESSLHIYHTENGYRITNVTIYNIFTK